MTAFDVLVHPCAAAWNPPCVGLNCVGLPCCPQVPIDIRKGITEEQVQTVVDGLAVRGDKKAAGQQIRGLYDLFVKADCTMVEVSGWKVYGGE